MLRREREIVVRRSEPRARGKQITEVRRESLRDPQAGRHWRVLVVERSELDRAKTLHVHRVEVLVADERRLSEVALLGRWALAVGIDGDGVEVLDAGARTAARDDVEKSVIVEREGAPESQMFLDEWLYPFGALSRAPLGVAEVDPSMRDAADRERG